MIASGWKITLDPDGTPLVLLDYGEMLREEMDFTGRRGYEITDLVRAAAPKLSDRGNLSVEFGFQVHRAAASWTAARTQALSDFFKGLSSDPLPLRIQDEGGGAAYHQFAQALVISGSSRLDDGEGGWVIATHQIVATGYSYTPAP